MRPFFLNYAGIRSVAKCRNIYIYSSPVANAYLSFLTSMEGDTIRYTGLEICNGVVLCFNCRRLWWAGHLKPLTKYFKISTQRSYFPSKRQRETVTLKIRHGFVPSFQLQCDTIIWHFTGVKMQRYEQMPNLSVKIYSLMSSKTAVFLKWHLDLETQATTQRWRSNRSHINVDFHP